ncbi:MAG: hypothetical protein U0N58_05480 [Senegalimassilia anaerobia]
MGFKFEKPQKARREARAAEEAQLTDHQKSYRDREKREEERGRFADLVKADDEGWTFGDLVRPVFEERIGLQNKRQLKPKEQKGTPVPNPLDSVETTDSLEGDSFAEAEAILKAFESLEVLPYYENVWSSAYYVVCVFRDSDDLESFIREFAMAKYGDLYMDGSKVLEALEG